MPLVRFAISAAIAAVMVLVLDTAPVEATKKKSYGQRSQGSTITGVTNSNKGNRSKKLKLKMIEDHQELHMQPGRQLYGG